MLYCTCEACHYSFTAQSLPDRAGHSPLPSRCPNCGGGPIREATGEEVETPVQQLQKLIQLQKDLSRTFFELKTASLKRIPSTAMKTQLISYQSTLHDLDVDLKQLRIIMAEES